MKVTLVGAGGKMGIRLTRNLKDSAYKMAYIEKHEPAREKLMEMGVLVSAEDEEIPDSDIVILAVPDNILGKVSNQIIPKMKSAAMVYTLDPACTLAGQLCHRDDLSYFSLRLLSQWCTMHTQRHQQVHSLLLFHKLFLKFD